MKVALIFPPMATPAQPYSSLPALTAFLRSRGRHQVMQFDANIEFTCRILTGRAVRAAAARIAEKLRRPDAWNGQPTSGDESSLLMTAALKAPIVAESIERAVSEIRHPDAFRDLARLDRAKRLIHDAFEVVSAGCLPVRLSATDCPQATPYTWSELDRWARDRIVNPFRQFFEGRWWRKLLRAAPGAIGVSITYESQLLAAVTLCTIVKERWPGIPIVLGGNIVSCWHERIEQCPEVFQWCDYLVAFEGESALESLLSALESGDSLDPVPNLVRRRGNRVIRNPCSAENIDALPTPDYRGLPLHLYLAPETVFLLNTSRGCYWSKCHFCSVSPSMRGRYRARRPELVMRDIETLHARHLMRCFMFGDDCVPPKTLEALASCLARAGLDTSWQCEVRFEPALTAELLQELARSGCRNLTFGLESYAPRVLSLMNKGIRHNEIRRILDDCRRFGIAFNLQLFFGFPGETEQEARRTVEFVLDEMHGAATCSFGLFRLLLGSGVARHPEAFGIRLIESASNPLAVQLEYAPLPEHAAAMKQLLRREILARSNFRYVAFSLDSHTLLFLGAAGVARMARDYYRYSQPGAASPDRERIPRATSWLVRKGNQTICSFPNSGEDPATRIVVYDYDLDETIEVSRFAAWVLVQFEAPKPAAELALQATQAATSPEEALRVSDTVDAVVAGLFKRGLLVEGRRHQRLPPSLPRRARVGPTLALSLRASGEVAPGGELGGR